MSCRSFFEVPSACSFMIVIMMVVDASLCRALMYAGASLFLSPSARGQMCL